LSYKISAGIDESELAGWIKSAKKKFGVFSDGRVNYTDSDIAPIVMCTLVAENKLLLAKRGHGLADANGYWSTINGFIDSPMPVAEVAAKELLEETGIRISPSLINVAKSYTLTSDQEKRTYIVYPCLARLKTKPEIILDSEHTDFVWINRAELDNYHILDDLLEAVDAALGLL
jgi:8-oxo-dGTP pyrophosphatase MutT (NUDIX family)